MSRANVERARRALEAAAHPRDVDALTALCAPDVEFHSTFAAIGGAVYRGADGLRQWDRDLDEAWGDIRNTPEALFDLGECTLVFGELSGRGRQSGVQVTMPVAFVLRWRGELLAYIKVYAHREDALSDLGMTEAELEAIAR
jgi:ketosteroid isomerase-like protein